MDVDGKKWVPADISKMKAPWYVEPSVQSEVYQVPEKPLVFANRVSQGEYDALYRRYLVSLGEQVEPEVGGVDVLEKRYVLVGNGKVTSSRCGQFLKLMVCPHVEKHNVLDLLGHSFEGKTDVHQVYHYCRNLNCPVCYDKGWAYREAVQIKLMIDRASKGFLDDKGIRRALGEPLHIVISVPAEDYSLPYKKLRAKALKIAKSRHIVGGVMIFHPKRYRKFDVVNGGIRKMRGWYFACHFHIIGFMDIDYSKCWFCSKMNPYVVKTGSGKVVKRIGNSVICNGCSGFEALARKLAWGDLNPETCEFTGTYRDSKGRLVKGDHYVVKVMERRKSIIGTARYLLNHAGLVAGVKKFHPAQWFGYCSSRRLHNDVKERLKLKLKEKRKCRICGSEMVEARYVGHNIYATFEGFNLPDFVADWVEHGENGYSGYAFQIVDSQAKFG